MPRLLATRQQRVQRIDAATKIRAADLALARGRLLARVPTSSRAPAGLLARPSSFADEERELIGALSHG